jgi:membrane protein DedA with SNARE-associated domain
MAAKRKFSIIDIGAVPMFIVLSLIGILVGSRWFLDPPNILTDGAIISLIGLACLLRVKFAKLRRGFSSPDTTETDIGERDYRTAFALVVVGAILVMVGIALIQTTPP